MDEKCRKKGGGEGNGVSAEVTIRNLKGLHLRFAGRITMTANQFRSEITVSRGRKRANAKSMLELVPLSATRGTVLTVSARGADQDAALAAMVELFETYTEE